MGEDERRRPVARGGDLRQRVEVRLDPLAELARAEVGRHGVDDGAGERRGQEADLELVEVAGVDVDIGLARRDLLESGGDGNGVVAMLARDGEGLVVADGVAQRRLARGATLDEGVHLRDLLDVGEVQRRRDADVRPQVVAVRVAGRP